MSQSSDESSLREMIRRLEEQRDELQRRRRRQLLVAGVCLSILVHLGLMLYLNVLRRAAPAPAAPQAVSLEFAVLQEPELTRLEESALEELTPEVALELDVVLPDEPLATLDPDLSAANLEISAAGSVPALGGAGAGEGGGPTLDGGGAGTSFFGVSSRGTRFAYIVDVSGSMGQDRKIDVCMRELARSIETLPDYAYFYIVLFSSDITLPPVQKGWTRARPNTLSNVIRWLNQIDPRGGTQPKPAFLQVFALRDRPDVIFFLTDGEIPKDTPETVIGLNARGKRVVINTIAFGDPTSQDHLQHIARRSGGVYRFVPSDQW